MKGKGLRHYKKKLDSEKQRQRVKDAAKAVSNAVPPPDGSMFDLTYPPRDGWARTEKRMASNDWHHVGYMSMFARQCPVCGAMPVFEQYVGDVTKEPGKKKVKNMPAETFVAVCPRCEVRAVGEGTLEECLRAWNDEDYSDDSLLVNGEIENINGQGLKELADCVWEETVAYGVDLVKRKHELQMALNSAFIDDVMTEVYYTELKGIRSTLTSLQKDVLSSPFGAVRDPESVLSDIRKGAYPHLSIDERLLIPLDLGKM